MDKISIIIPVYNVEPYIRKCLDSIINQTHKNLEIILIDDGSTDNSGKICDEYAGKDSRFIVYHKENGGVSSAKNIGLKNFTGEYLGFIDPDDWAEPQMYEVLLKTLIDNDVLLSAVNFTRDTDNESVPETSIAVEKIPSGIISSREMLLYIIRKIHYAGFFSGLCNKLFRSDIIRNSNLVFDETLLISEGFRFLSGLFTSFALTGIFIEKPMYHYRQRNNSLLHSPSLNKSLGQLRAYEEIIREADERGFKDVTVWLKRDHCYRSSILFEDSLKNNGGYSRFFLEKTGVFADEYIKTQIDYPDRIKRINKILGFDLENRINEKV